MTIAPTNAAELTGLSGAPQPPRAPLRARQQEFDAALSRQQAQARPGDVQSARDAAADFVAAAFIEPLLKHLRENSQAAPPFAPGPGEKQFRGIADAQIARRVARAANFPLVDRIASDLLRGGAAAGAAAASASTQPAGPGERPRPTFDLIGGTHRDATR